MRDADADYRQLLAWRLQPHVREFWDMDDDHGNFTYDDILKHYGPERDGREATVRAFIELDSEPIGYIQFYPWAAYVDEAEQLSIPLEGETWGLDVFIGDPGSTNQGLGSRAVDLLSRYLFDSQGATSVALLTELANLRAQRAYEKAGFHKVRQVLDLDERDGERVKCWLMVRERPTA
jgi:RimJ/RimL family protein N-acetyltransferase